MSSKHYAAWLQALRMGLMEDRRRRDRAIAEQLASRVGGDAGSLDRLIRWQCVDGTLQGLLREFPWLTVYWDGEYRRGPLAR